VNTGAHDIDNGECHLICLSGPSVRGACLGLGYCVQPSMEWYTQRNNASAKPVRINIWYKDCQSSHWVVSLLVHNTHTDLALMTGCADWEATLLAA